MNEKTFIVSVSLNTQTARQKFESHSFGMGIPYKIMDGLYCVKTPYDSTSEIVRNQIVALLSNQCFVFVMKASIEAAWRLNVPEDSWLRNNI